jgi:hypothetical protein
LVTTFVETHNAPPFWNDLGERVTYQKNDGFCPGSFNAANKSLDFVAGVDYRFNKFIFISKRAMCFLETSAH